MRLCPASEGPSLRKVKLEVTKPGAEVSFASSRLRPPDEVQTRGGGGSPPSAVQVTTTVELIRATNTPPVT